MKTLYVFAIATLLTGCILDESMFPPLGGGSDDDDEFVFGEPERPSEPEFEPTPASEPASDSSALDYESYIAAMPSYYTQGAVADSDNTPFDNRVTNAGAHLGRVLFYDTRLSANDTTSCASCHLQSAGFADPGQFSVGFAGGLTGRNSPGLANARFYQNGRFFWDERAATLEDQVLMPIQDAVEMGLDLRTLQVKVERTDFYPALFDDAFGDPDVSADRISLALSQFVRTLVSYQSKFDRSFVEGTGIFTDEERLGEIVFEEAKCNRCHTGTAMVATRASNNGLDFIAEDDGAGGARFKVPSLRNIAVTAPYMHDGRFETLRGVVEHYDNGVEMHPDLSPILMEPGTGFPMRLDLSNREKSALVAFMETMTDDAFLEEPLFSDPFEP